MSYLNLVRTNHCLTVTLGEKNGVRKVGGKKRGTPKYRTQVNETTEIKCRNRNKSQTNYIFTANNDVYKKQVSMGGLKTTIKQLSNFANPK